MPTTAAASPRGRRMQSAVCASRGRLQRPTTSSCAMRAAAIGRSTRTVQTRPSRRMNCKLIPSSRGTAASAAASRTALRRSMTSSARSTSSRTPPLSRCCRPERPRTRNGRPAMRRTWNTTPTAATQRSAVAKGTTLAVRAMTTTAQATATTMHSKTMRNERPRAKRATTTAMGRMVGRTATRKARRTRTRTAIRRRAVTRAATWTLGRTARRSTALRLLVTHWMGRRRRPPSLENGRRAACPRAHDRATRSWPGSGTLTCRRTTQIWSSMRKMQKSCRTSGSGHMWTTIS
mmetsp:Transcript_84316/g.140593  ORF Transcript_84316/g.140593 Transcript_84316/m.140593 type:complete len:291 (-) Transcript_84316:58-930(-)